MTSRLWLAPLVLLLATGCMTLDSRGDASYHGPRTYSGVRQDAAQVGTFFSQLNPLFVLFIADMPFSLLADTLLLPLTIPEERARQAELAEALTRPSPPVIEALPDESPEEAARRLFEECTRRLENLLDSLTDCYGAGARAELRDALARLRASGDILSYRKARYAREGDAVRVEAVRVSAQSAQTQPTSFLIGRDEAGDWRIVEQTGAPWL